MALYHQVVWALSLLLAIVTCGSLDAKRIFARPVLARVYEQNWFTLGSHVTSEEKNYRVERVASALSTLRPSYVNGLLYARYGTEMQQHMVDAYSYIRKRICEKSPNARFDIEISLNPHGASPFPNATALSAYMSYVDSKIHVDGWWFDFWSTAWKVNRTLVTAAVQYAHSHNQTVGGNVFDNYVPSGSDAVAFVDAAVQVPHVGKTHDSKFGFGVSVQQMAQLKDNAAKSEPPTVVLGHYNSNPQNGNTTLSCVLIQEWNATQRVEYMAFWLDLQRKHNFTFMLPVFFPLCPGACSYNPLTDYLSHSGNATFDKLLQRFGKVTRQDLGGGWGPNEPRVLDRLSRLGLFTVGRVLIKEANLLVKGPKSRKHHSSHNGSESVEDGRPPLQEVRSVRTQQQHEQKGECWSGMSKERDMLSNGSRSHDMYSTHSS